MIQPNDEPHFAAMERAIEEMSIDAEDAPTGLAERLATRPPVVPVAGAGGGAWGPTSPTAAPSPTASLQIEQIHMDVQRLIDALVGMQKALAVIKGKL